MKILVRPETKREDKIEYIQLTDEKLRRLRERRIYRYNQGEKRHQIQIKFHESKATIRFMFGGNRSGKTTPGSYEGACQSLGYNPFTGERYDVPNTGWVVTESFEHAAAAGSVQDKYLFWLPKSEIEDIKYRYKNIIHYIQLKNGSKIVFKSYEQGRKKFGSASISWIHLDEEPPEEIFDECLMRIIDTEGRLWCTMTPLNGINWVYDRIYNSNDKNIEWWFTSIYDNPFLTRTQIEKAVSSFDEETREARIYGRFVPKADLIYPEWKREKHVIDIFDINQENFEKKIYIGIDPGVNHPAVLYMLVDKDQNKLVFDEIYESNKSISIISEKIKEKNKRYKIENPIYYIDPAARSRNPITMTSILDEYVKNGINAYEADNDVHNGILKVKELLRINPETGNPKLFVFKSCINFIREIENYVWKKIEDIPREKPLKKGDHLMDCLRYICVMNPSYYSIEREKREYIPDDSIVGY